MSWRPNSTSIPGGSYTTEELVEAAALLREHGWPIRDTYALYQPFLVVGRAAWSDTWGAPRHGPGSLVRQHEGQDVFCEYGAPVLAVEEGVVEFDIVSLGGRVAKLHRTHDGGFWYYAHLSDWNTRDFASGSDVHEGDVIGYCGNTGNAIRSAPHVHFGWYGPEGDARDPMLNLIRWLEMAERRATSTLAELGLLAPEERVSPDPITSDPLPRAPADPGGLVYHDVFGAELERPLGTSAPVEIAGLCTIAWLAALTLSRFGRSPRLRPVRRRNATTQSVGRRD